ncbi:MAG: hypothetical protein EON48_19025 [Acetobacteraceae bacterium]|nr:MAG: hypothetical protein EON48_19025 [Acetobacteraceae bacterium]
MFSHRRRRARPRPSSAVHPLPGAPHSTRRQGCPWWNRRRTRRLPTGRSRGRSARRAGPARPARRRAAARRAGRRACPSRAGREVGSHPRRAILRSARDPAPREK